MVLHALLVLRGSRRLEPHHGSGKGMSAIAGFDADGLYW